jgi:hypothetical protein
MKKVTRTMIIALVLGLSAIALGIDTTGLVSYWNFDEGAGDTAHDIIGDNDGDVNGASWQGGIEGGSLMFDGVDDYVGIGNPASLNFEGEITIAAWLKSRSSEPWLENIISHGFSPEPVREVFLRVHDGEYQLGSYIRNTPRSEVVYPIPAEDFNNWVHIVGLYDGSNWKLYRNGQLANSKSATRGSITVNAGWAIGAKGDGEERFFDGLIDEVMIFNKGLSAEEVNELYQYGIVEPTLTGLEIAGPNEVAEEYFVQYRAIATYSNDTTEDVTDSVGWIVSPDNYADINDTGLLSTYELVMPTEEVTIFAQYEEGNEVVQAEKDVQIFALCPQDSALHFNGINNFAQIPYIERYQFQVCTIAAWIRPDIGWREVRPVQFIVGQNEDLVNDRCGPRLYARRPEEGVSFTYENDADTDYVYASSYEPADGRWTHICATRTSDRVVSLYANGELIQSWNNTGTPATISMAEFRIGSGCNAPPVCGGYFAGTIDEIVMYNTSLSASKIQALMSKGPLLTDLSLLGYWNFDEGQGQIAHDSSVYGNDAYLGSDPCEPDSADPCWVKDGAPSHCTARQMIVRNVRGAQDDKAAADELIDSALEKERASAKLLIDDMKRCKRNRRNPWNILWPAREIYRSIGLEYQCRDKLQDSVEALERALQWLFDEAVSTQPGKQGKAINSTERR